MHSVGAVDAPLRLFGVDGCRGGWIVAESRGRSAPPDFWVVRTFAALLAVLDGERALIAIDIPIGLPGGPPHDDGRRRCDAAARALLGRRSVSVFSAPCRQTHAAESYADACRLEVAARQRGKGISQQAYGILPKIAEVDRAMTLAHQEAPGAIPGTWVREVHPEVTFAVLNGGDGPARPLSHAKRLCRACRRIDRCCPGEADRLALLRAWLGAFDPGAVRQQLASEHGGGARLTDVGRDDIVDAVACLATAERIAAGVARTLPPEPQIDQRGLRMEIIA
jgi:predicted RNase H-like nuclease